MVLSALEFYLICLVSIYSWNLMFYYLFESFFLSTRAHITLLNGFTEHKSLFFFKTLLRAKRIFFLDLLNHTPLGKRFIIYILARGEIAKGVYLFFSAYVLKTRHLKSTPLIVLLMTWCFEFLFFIFPHLSQGQSISSCTILVPYKLEDKRGYFENCSASSSRSGGEVEEPWTWEKIGRLNGAERTMLRPRCTRHEILYCLLSVLNLHLFFDIGAEIFKIKYLLIT